MPSASSVSNMLNRTPARPEQPEGKDVGEYAALLRDALRSGLRALEDPAVELRVRNYFEENPTFSRDPVHVAAVATRFAAQQYEVSSEPQLDAPRVKH